MSITDELRKYADKVDAVYGKFSISAMMRDIADRIDERHERELREQYNDGFDEGFASADDWDDDHADALAEHGWVKLPVDADGKVIRIGDKMVCDYTYGETITVLGFGAQNDHDDDQGVFAHNGDECCWFNADCLHHVERPTVEDVLREFGMCWDDPAHYAKGELVETYADRIREALRDE